MTDAVRTRPKNRRASILVAAGIRFHQRGYAATSLEDIAGDLGVTAPALYRHFRSKDHLFTAVLEVNLGHLESCIQGATSTGDVIDGLARVAVEHPTLGLLWNTDRRRRLVDPDGSIRERILSATDDLGALLGHRADPELVPLLARAVLAAASSTGFYESGLGAQEQVDELRRALGVAATFAPQRPLVELEVATEGASPKPWATRRSAILDAGASLVVLRGGYHSVTIEEIAAAAGVSPNTVYLHFSGKADLFAAVLRRVANWLTASLQQASAQATSAIEALSLAIAASLEISAQHPSWTGSLADEMTSLPDDQIVDVVATVGEYLEEWLALCAAVAPSVPIEAVRVRMRAALAVVDDRASGAAYGRVLSSDDTVDLVLAMITSE